MSRTTVDDILDSMPALVEYDEFVCDTMAKAAHYGVRLGDTVRVPKSLISLFRWGGLSANDSDPNVWAARRWYPLPRPTLIGVDWAKDRDRTTYLPCGAYPG